MTHPFIWERLKEYYRTTPERIDLYGRGVTDAQDAHRVPEQDLARLLREEAYSWNVSPVKRSNRFISTNRT